MTSRSDPKRLICRRLHALAHSERAAVVQRRRPVRVTAPHRAARWTLEGEWGSPARAPLILRCDWRGGRLIRLTPRHHAAWGEYHTQTASPLAAIAAVSPRLSVFLMAGRAANVRGLRPSEMILMKPALPELALHRADRACRSARLRGCSHRRVRRTGLAAVRARSSWGCARDGPHDLPLLDGE